MATINVIDTSLHISSFPVTYVPPGPLQAFGIVPANITSQSTSAVSGAVAATFASPFTSNPLAGNSFNLVLGNTFLNGTADLLAGYFTVPTGANQTIIPVGFAPTKVTVIDWTTFAEFTWMYGAPATDTKKELATPAISVNTGSAIVDTADYSGGFGDVTYVSLASGIFTAADVVSFRIEA
jgi:hypothetical protein